MYDGKFSSQANKTVKPPGRYSHSFGTIKPGFLQSSCALFIDGSEILCSFFFLSSSFFQLPGHALL
jgi:hypothetical protein